MISSNVRQCLSQFSQYQEQLALKYLLQLDVPNQEIDKFNTEFENLLKYTFIDLIKSNHIDDILSLIKVLIEAMKNPIIKCKIILNLLLDFFECIMLEDLKKIIVLLYENIKKFQNLQIQQIYLFHRILKFGLSRFPFGDTLIRGKLHLLITFVLEVAHQSGMKYKQLDTKTIQNCITLEQFELTFQNSQINYQLYHNYWKLQKYLSYDEKKQQNRMIKGILQIYKHRVHQDISTALYRLVNHVSQVANSVNYIMKYFSDFPIIKENDNNLNLDIDLTPLPHYFFKYSKYQLFRFIIIFQILIYCSNLSHKIIQNKINNNVINQFIKNMQNTSKNYVKEHINLKEGKYIFKMFDKYFQNQAKWIQIKNNTKKFINEVKRPVYKIKGIKQIGLQDNALKSNPSNQSNVFPYQSNIQKQQQKYKQAAMTQLNIHKNKMQTYLTILNEKISPKCERQASFPSFSIYFKESFECLQTFNYNHRIQTHFYDSQYNLFQWKAMRSLCRQNSNFLFQSNLQNVVFRDYPLLQFMRKKAPCLYQQPKKKLRPYEQQTDPQ